MTELSQWIGRSRVSTRQARSILTRATGFIGAFDYTLNPYSGCTFGCSYCYAAFFAKDPAHQQTWGDWVEVKVNALALLRKKRKRPLIDKTLYLSSVTDPYQPIERQLELTRSLLEELLTHHQVNLVIQTRGTLVTRDIDLLRRFRRVQVNMTVTTDDDDVRKGFEPMCPSNTRRLEAIAEVQASGIRTCITMTPLLPVRDPFAFAEALAATEVPRFVVQYFHQGKVRFAAGTGERARQLAQQLEWTEQDYRAVIEVLRAYLPNVEEGQEGFRPRW